MAALNAEGTVTETLADGFSIVCEPSDVGWVVTATDDADATLVQYTCADEVDAMLLVDTLKGCDLSDLL